MAAESSVEYAVAWIYALALLVEVDPMELKLTDKQVEVAFALTKHYKRCAAGEAHAAVSTSAGGAAGGVQAAAMEEDKESDDDDDTAASLGWEPQLEDLPNDLQQVLARHTAGTLVLDARGLMEELPTWANLMSKAETNNHKADLTSRYDRTLRCRRQKVTALLRGFAHPRERRG